MIFTTMSQVTITKRSEFEATHKPVPYADVYDFKFAVVASISAILDA